jgi:hypothetical protein
MLSSLADFVLAQRVTPSAPAPSPAIAKQQPLFTLTSSDEEYGNCTCSLGRFSNFLPILQYFSQLWAWAKTRWATVDCCMLMISQLALDVDYDRRVMVISLSTDEKHEGQS